MTKRSVRGHPTSQSAPGTHYDSPCPDTLQMKWRWKQFVIEKGVTYLRVPEMRSKIIASLAKLEGDDLAHPAFRDVMSATAVSAAAEKVDDVEQLNSRFRDVS